MASPMLRRSNSLSCVSPRHRAHLEPFLRSCGFKDAALQWLPAVGPSGQNLVSPPTEPALAAWCGGPTVVAAIDGFQPASRAAAGLPLRMPVADLWKSHRGGLEISGKLEVCSAHPWMQMALLPCWHMSQVKITSAA